MLTLILFCLVGLPDALPDAIPDVTPDAAVRGEPTPAPPKPELPKPKKRTASGHWENRRQCGQFGCSVVPVWVPDEQTPNIQPSAPPAPHVEPSEEETQPAESQDWYYPRRFRWRR